MGARDRIVKIWEALLDCVFPRACRGCGAPDTWLCLKCRDCLLPYGDERCPWCHGVTVRDGATCDPCHADEAGYPDRLIVAYDYADPVVERLVHDCKFRGYYGLGRVMGELLAEHMREQGVVGNVAVVPIPLHASRERERGFNQAAVMARVVARGVGVEYAPKVLLRTKQTAQQAKLSRAERLTNVAEAFAVTRGQSVAGKTVVLIDDVCTTGATLAAAAKVLRAAGATTVWAAAFARNIDISPSDR